MAVFISYNSRDFNEPRVEGISVPARIKLAIDSAVGVSTFFDRSSIRPGDNWRDAISNGLQRSQVLLVLAGPKFFEEDQIRRLEQNDSIIRHELLTARQLATCSILPLYYGTKPPHRSGKPWPQEFEWLQDLQWTEIRVDQVDLNAEVIAREICEIFASDLIKSLQIRSDLAHLIAQLAKASLSVRQSLIHLLSSPQTRSLMLQGLNLGEILNKTRIINWMMTNESEPNFDEAVTGRGVFRNVDLPLRIIFILCNIGTNNGSITQTSLSGLDYELREHLAREQSARRPLRKPDQLAQLENQYLVRFVLIILQRTRERNWKLNLDTSQSLSDLYADIKRLPRNSQLKLSDLFQSLIEFGISVHPEDLSSFRGAKKLKSVVRVVRNSSKPRRNGRNIPKSNRTSNVSNRGKSPKK
jgi:hypothetical protein